MTLLNAIDPTPEQIKAFLAHEKAGEPVHMLNLLKFKERASYRDAATNPDNNVSGETAYFRYAKAFGEMMRAKDIGFETSFAGRMNALMIGAAAGADTPAGPWDMAAIARYPNAQTMLECVSSAAYREIHYHRKAGLEGQLLISCSAEHVF
jgi:hypothetical protein